MISQICGKIQKKKQSSVLIDVGGFSYEVMIPPAVMKSIEKAKDEDGNIRLITYHYYQMDPSRAIPVLVGFLNEIEKEFFEQFITVSGVGPKAACRALAQPFSVIADAIDRGDMSLLKTLPGIGEQKAREIIAKLQGKIGKFGLIQDRPSGEEPSVKEDVKEEAVEVLLQLQYKRNEARDMVEAAVKRNPKLATCEEILNEVYKGSRKR
ncbi:MAG: helix-hairpin-helix domain-containing protein [Candidatus Omnitrophica bacterium]|nr:helix-hairpin-helix domain-containing protein [Candidatus Omnitrophota bacterium]MCM8790460.1 helix-hairpin-helix domain-containing protein [Candidatus Omnitrophota bacterium]